MSSADDDLNPIVEQVWDHYGTWNNNTVGKYEVYRREITITGANTKDLYLLRLM